jgi:Aerotolerance regulator N-terminal
MILAFATPWLLWTLAALPLLWLLLRAIPPAPIRRRFPGVALLLGLTDQDRQAERTPWWLLALRMAAAALMILGFAGPVLNPEPGAGSDRPLLVIVDGGWAEAQDWATRQAQATEVVARAGRDGRTVALIRLSDAPGEIAFQAADAVAARLPGLEPHPWLPDPARWAGALPEGGFDSYWLADGIDHPGRAALLAELAQRGTVSVFQTGAPSAKPAGRGADHRAAA